MNRDENLNKEWKHADTYYKASKPILSFFEYKHLPDYLQAVSVIFYDVARKIDLMHGCPREKQIALRKLLESKDAAVMAML